MTPHATTAAPSRAHRSPLADRSPGDPLDLLAEHMRKHPRIDGGAFLLVDPERTSVRPAMSWFASPLLGDAMAAVLERPYQRTVAGFTEAALERGRALFMPRVEDWEAARSLRAVLGRAGPALDEELWTAYARASVIACPVRTSLGAFVGTFEVASFDPGRPLLTGDLATVEALADLAGLAHERSTWLDNETARARVELKLKRAAADVSGSLETSDVLANLIEHALAAVGGDRALVSRILPSGELQRAALRPGDGGPAFDPAQIAEVARTNKLSVSTQPDPAVHVPVSIGHRLFGVMSVARAGHGDFSGEDIELLSRLARSSMASIGNAAQFEQERRVARALTRGFMPDTLSTVEGYEVAALYEPAEGEAAGGDIYGAWERPDKTLALLIGDVSGKGAGAAELSAMTRFFVEARSWDGGGPAEILGQAGRMLAERLPEDTFVTAFLAILDGDTIRCSNAGHPHPVVLKRDGTVAEITAGSLPLGVEPGLQPAEVTVAIAPGDLLYAYTDGLTEARRGIEMLGADRLLSFLGTERARPGDLGRFVAAVHEDVRVWADALLDDCTALAVRRT